MIYRFRTAESGENDYMSPAGQYDYVSPGVFRILGYTPDEMYADPGLFRKAVHPDYASIAIADEHYRLSATEDFHVGPPIKRVHKSGKIVWTETRTTLIHDTTGDLVAVEGIIRDVTELMEAEEALRRSEEVFRLLAENAQDMVFRYRTVEPRGFEYVSPASERIFGYASEEFYADPEIGSKVFPPDDRTLLNAVRRDRGAVAGLWTARCMKKNGNTVWVEISRTPIRDDAGNVVAIEGVARDVTERVQREEALRQNEKRFRLLAENAQDMIYRYRVVEPRGFDYVCPACERISGYTREEFYADPEIGSKLFHLDDRSLIQQASADPAAMTEPMTVRLTTKSGRGIWVDILRTLIYDDAGKIVAVEGSCRNVTERKVAEEALRQSEERFRLLAENAQDMIYRYRVAEPRGFEYVSPACETLVGYTPEELYADPGLVLTGAHPEDRAKLAGLDEPWDSKTQTMTIRWMHKNGTERWIEMRRTPIFDDQGTLVAVEGIIRDVTERMEAEEALRRSEEGFRLLAENAQDIVYYFRLAPTPSIEYISPAAEAILGYKPAEFLGYPDLLTDIIHPDDRHLVGTLLQNDEHADQPISLRVLPKHGGVKWIELSRSVIHDDSGQPVAIQGIVRDVTERMEAEEALRQNEERFRLLAENAQDMIYRYRVAEPRGFEYVSPACETLVGYTPEELYADPGLVLTGMHPEDRAKLAVLDEPWDSKTQTMTIRWMHKNGTERWIETRRTPIFDDQGTLVAVQGMNRDVTERLEAEEALRQSEERFRLLAENAQDIVYRVRVRPERKVEYVSPSIERILGYSQEEYYADPPLGEQTIHEDDRRLRLLDPLVGEAATQPQLVRCIARDGRTVWMERRSSPIRDADGEIVGWHGISRDVTEQVRLLEQVRVGERRLRAFSRRLAETQEADRRFIALELHDEVGQMLTGIKMFLEKLGRIGKSNKWLLKNAFKLVEDAMKRVQDLSLELRPAMLDHLGIVPTLKWYVKRYASRNGVEVKLRQSGVDRRFDPDLETAVYRIVQEGLTNVARHAGTGRASVQLQVIDNVLHLAMEDSGRGFDANTALDSPKSVGLVGMIERATSLGGELRINSAPGHGTRLHATFPLNGDPRAAQ